MSNSVQRALASQRNDSLTIFGQQKVESEQAIVQEIYSYSINPRIFKTTLVAGGTVSQADSMAVVGSSTTTASTATLETIKKCKYRSGEGLVARFSALFTAGVAGTTQLAGVGNAADFLGFGYNGASFGVLHRNNSSDTWYSSSSWNFDKGDGKGRLPVMDWGKLNVFQVRFQFLGAGALELRVENPVNGLFELVHRISYANANTVPSFANPIMGGYYHVDNGATTSDIVLKSASMYLGVEGSSRRHGFTNAVSFEKTGLGAVETNIMTLRNRAMFASKANLNLIFPLTLSITSIGGTKPAVIRLRLNPTVAGTPAFSDVATTTSIGELDTAGTDVSAGDLLYATVLNKEDSISVDLSKLEMVLSPSDELVISAQTASGTVDINASLTYLNDI